LRLAGRFSVHVKPLTLLEHVPETPRLWRQAWKALTTLSPVEQLTPVTFSVVT
jgi:hypothetical protein